MATIDIESVKRLVLDGELTPRQGQVVEHLIAGETAREIADKLDITRNAVYSQITAIKKKGVLDEFFTPSGELRVPAQAPDEGSLDYVDQPQRERFVRAGERGQTQAHLDVIKELVDQNRRLLEIIDRLSK